MPSKAKRIDCPNSFFDPKERSSSSLFSLLALLLLLFLWEGVHHQEFAVSWIPLRSQIRLVLVWHQNRTFKRFHDRDVDVSFVFFVTTILRLGQVVTNRLNFLHLDLPGAVKSILRDMVDTPCELLDREAVLRGSEFGQGLNSGDLFDSWCEWLTILTFLLRRWLPAWEPLDQVFSRVGSQWPS